MSRCKCCDVILTGSVRYKSGEEYDGLFIEEDMCNACIFVVDNSDYLDSRYYQFGDYTEDVLNIV